MTVIRQYNPSTSQWEVVAVGQAGNQGVTGPSGPAGATGPRQHVGTTPPASPTSGDQWFNSELGRQLVYYDGYWVEVGNSLRGDPGLIASTTAPLDTSVLWLDTDEEADGLYVPPGGSSNQVLAKVSGANYDVAWQTPAAFVPTGGTTGQVLAKSSGTDHALTWAHERMNGCATHNLYVVAPYSVSTYSYAAGSIWAVLMAIPSQCTVTSLAITVNAGAASTSARLGLYSALANSNLPGNLVIDAGLADLSTTGQKDVACSVSVAPGLYWFVTWITGTGSPSLFGITQGSYASGGIGPFPQTIQVPGALTASAFSLSFPTTDGPLPALFPINSASTQRYGVHGAVRVSL